MTRIWFLIFLLPVTGALGQIQGPSMDGEPVAWHYSIGVSGTYSIVDPENINDGIHFVNTTLDLNVPRVNALLSGSAFFRMWVSPKMYAVLRGEYGTFSRSFQYAAPVTTTGSTGSSSFTVSNERRYEVIPIGIGAGFRPSEYSTFEAEIGFHYALGTIKETGTMEGYGSYSSTYDGAGMGFWLTVRPHIMLSDAVSLAPELTGRLLLIREFRDQSGRELRDFNMNLSSISLGLSFAVHF